VTRSDIPATEYGTTAEAFDGAPMPARFAEEGRVVHETTVEVFVARRE
jgi:hypothetical protein